VPYPPCTVTAFWLKYQVPIAIGTARCLRRVTQPPHIAGPLAATNCGARLEQTDHNQQVTNQNLQLDIRLSYIMKTTISKLKIGLLISLIPLAICCSNRKNTSKEDAYFIKPYPHVIKMTEGMQNNAQIKLSEIADSIKYIILSKDKKVIIGSTRSIQMSKSNIFLKSDNLVMRFDMTGKYLNSFGKLGRGPEEYLAGSVFSTTPNFDKVLILRSMMYDYLTFKPDGEYISKNEITYSRNLYDFTCISDSTILMTFWFIGSFMNEDVLKSMPGVAGLYNLNGKPIKIIESPLKNKAIETNDLKRVISSNPTFTYFDNRVVLSTEGDTIHEVDKNSIIPGFILDWGQTPHNQTTEELYYRQSGQSNKVINYMPLIETTAKAFFRGRNMNDYFIFEYDKITGKCRSMITDQDNLGFINDLDGGANFYPYWTNRTGNVWILEQDAYSFKEKHNNEFLSNSIALYPAMKKKLREFVDSLKQDDNPVLLIVYLKNYHDSKF
jgi:hypothetical protein